MPEGPSIVILKECVQRFNGKRIIKASGDAKIDYHAIQGKTIEDFMSWGKHFLICFKYSFLRIHLLMFCTYLIDDNKQLQPRLHLEFKDGELNFYTCSVKYITENVHPDRNPSGSID